MNRPPILETPWQRLCTELSLTGLLSRCVVRRGRGVGGCGCVNMCEVCRCVWCVNVSGCVCDGCGRGSESVRGVDVKWGRC